MPSMPADFRDQIERFNHDSDEDVTSVMNRLADAIRVRNHFRDGLPQIVRELRAASSITVTGEQRARVLWKALPEVRAGDKAYRSPTTTRIWDYLVAQAHEYYPDNVTADDISRYDGRLNVRTSSPPPAVPTYRDSWLRRTFDWCLYQLLRLLRLEGNSLD